MTEEHLKQTIYNAPTSEEAWGAYGQFLSSKGDAHGELIVLELSGGSERVAEIYRQNKPAWLGDKLNTAMQAPEATGFMGKVSRIFSTPPKLPLKLEWQYGFIKEVHIKQGWDKSTMSPSETMQLAFASPATEFTQYFSIDFHGHDDMASEVIKGFNGHSLKAMKKIHLGNFLYPDENEISWVSVGNVNELFQLFPELEELHLTGSEIELGEVKHQKLQKLILETGALPSKAIKSVMSASLPELADLEMWFGDEEYGADGDINMLAPLFSQDLFPCLKRLALKNGEFQNDIVKSLANSQLLEKVQFLDLSLGTLTDEGTEPFIEHHEKFKHLESINLSSNFISDEICNSLKKLYGVKIDVSDQDIIEDEDSVYVSVGE